MKSVYWGEKKIKGGRKYMYDGKILKNTSGYIERIGNKKGRLGKILRLAKHGKIASR